MACHTDRRTARHSLIDSASDPDQSYIYFMGTETLPSILYGVGKAFFCLWARKRFLLRVTYFPTNLVDPFTQRVTGIKIVNLRVYNGRFFICICALLRIKNYLIHMHNVQK